MHTVSGLIEALKSVAEVHGGDTQVRVARIANGYPSECPLQDLATVHLPGNANQVTEPGPTVLYLLVEPDGDTLAAEARPYFGV